MTKISSDNNIGPLLKLFESLSSKQQQSRTGSDDIQQRRQKNQIFLLDGGTGEELFRRGVPDDRKLWSATAIVHAEYHSVVEDVHRSFLQAGSNAITTNTYGLVPGVGFSLDEISKYCLQAGEIARESVKNYKSITENKVSMDQPGPFVFGSLGPLLESYRGDKIMDHKDGVTVYYRMIVALSQFVDAFLAETLSSLAEAEQVVDAISQFCFTVQTNVAKTIAIPLFLSFTVNATGQLRSTENASYSIRKILEIAELKKVQILAFLFNCSEPESITLALEHVNSDMELMQELEERSILLGAYANRLTPISENWELSTSQDAQPLRGDLNPAQYHTCFVQQWVSELNVKIIGGCCGITPDHISHIQLKLNHLT
jgi:S-methylmethionine-dependent homocysteine/selenocysteine methylase